MTKCSALFLNNNKHGYSKIKMVPLGIFKDVLLFVGIKIIYHDFCKRGIVQDLNDQRLKGNAI